MKHNSSLEFLETLSQISSVNPDERQDEGLSDSPESMCSDVFVVEEPTNHEESLTSSKVAEYLDKVQQ